MRVISCIASFCLTVDRIVVHPTATSLSIDVSSVTKLVSVVTARGGRELVSGSSGLVGVISIGGGRAAFR